MAGYYPEQTNRGNYRCPYCGHKVWKRSSAAQKHIADFHKDEAELASLKSSNERKDNIINSLRSQLEAAKRPAKKKTEYYDAVIFCEQCQAIYKTGMPKGYETKNVRCSVCGLCRLHIVINAPNWW